MKGLPARARKEASKNWMLWNSNHVRFRHSQIGKKKNNHSTNDQWPTKCFFDSHKTKTAVAFWLSVLQCFQGRHALRQSLQRVEAQEEFLQVPRWEHAMAGFTNSTIYNNGELGIVTTITTRRIVLIGVVRMIVTSITSRRRIVDNLRMMTMTTMTLTITTVVILDLMQSTTYGIQNDRILFNKIWREDVFWWLQGPEEQVEMYSTSICWGPFEQY